MAMSLPLTWYWKSNRFPQRDHWPQPSQILLPSLASGSRHGLPGPGRQGGQKLPVNFYEITIGKTLRPTTNIRAVMSIVEEELHRGLGWRRASLPYWGLARLEVGMLAVIVGDKAHVVGVGPSRAERFSCQVRFDGRGVVGAGKGIVEAPTTDGDVGLVVVHVAGDGTDRIVEGVRMRLSLARALRFWFPRRRVGTSAPVKAIH